MSGPIVVVDDDEMGARAVARALRPRRVLTAGTASLGIELATSLDPELVIVDFYLPDGSGREVINALRASGSRAPVLLVSAAIDLRDWVEWAAYLANDFLPKPFPLDLLRNKVERLVTEYELQRRAKRQHDTLVAMRERDEQQGEAARRLLDQITHRNQFAPGRMRLETIPAGSIGGDIVCSGALADGRQRWLVGDVCGHTLASALVTVPISMIFHATVRRMIPLGEVVETLDHELASMLPPTMFLAAVVCELDLARNTLSVANAACPDVLVRYADGVGEFASTSRPLGIRRSDQLPEIDTRAIEPGDRIYAVTDGLLDLPGTGGHHFGAERYKELVRTCEPARVFDVLGAAWRDHVRDGEVEDDLSIVEVVA